VIFVPTTLCVVSQRVFIIVVYFVTDSVRNLLDIPSYRTWRWSYNSTRNGGEWSPSRYGRFYAWRKSPQ